MTSLLSEPGQTRDYYRFTYPDGTQEIRPLTYAESKEAAIRLKQEYAAAVQEWRERKKEWSKALPNKRYPIPMPCKVGMRRLGRRSAG